MRVPSRVRRSQILKAAVTLFARQGFEGTTTRQIAKLADVNEAIIFRHFRSKEELYWAVIDEKCRAAQGRDELARKLRRNGSDREVFASIAKDVLRRSRADKALSRLLLYSALENHGLSHRFFKNYVAERYEMLAKFIGSRIEAGEFRRVDPLLAARGFLGMVIYQAMIQELFGGKRDRRFNARAVGEAMADIWLDGMKAQPRSAGREQAGQSRAAGPTRKSAAGVINVDDSGSARRVASASRSEES